MEKQNNTRFVTTAVILSLLVAAAIVVGVRLYVQKRPERMHQSARSAAFERRYEEMQQALAWLEANGDAQKYQQTLLQAAALADYNGDYDLALELLDTAEDGAAADELRAQCIYHQALEQYETGDYLRAARTAASANGYEPAQSLAEMAQLAYQASLPTPTPSPTPSPTPIPTPSPVPTAAAVPVEATSTPVPTPEPTPKPELWSAGRIAVGFAHTVVLREDGTVLAVGDNSFGQTEVGEWRDVTAIAAGAYHTIGLTRDGRVLSCGDNTYLQCDTALYAGCAEIAAGDYATFVRMPTGEVIAMGFQTYDFLKELAPAEKIWAGSYGLAVRCADGVHFSHPGLVLESGSEFALSRGYAIGMDEQGKTCATTDLLPVWKEVGAVSAGESAALALTEDGRVLAHAFGNYHQYDFSFDQPVLAASAGANHCAFVLADGTLVIRFADGTEEKHGI